MNSYVEHVEGGYRIGQSRVSLESVVHAYLSGQTAESIAQAYPALTLEQVHGSLAFYLSHRPEVDSYLEQCEAGYDAQRESSRAKDPMFYQKLADSRTAHQSTR
jgi:uncharacterized protein (DUF433 family)